MVGNNTNVSPHSSVGQKSGWTPASSGLGLKAEAKALGSLSNFLDVLEENLIPSSLRLLAEFGSFVVSVLRSLCPCWLSHESLSQLLQDVTSLSCCHLCFLCGDGARRLSPASRLSDFPLCTVFSATSQRRFSVLRIYVIRLDLPG